MFVSDRVVFVELHKTGCTHIRNALLELVGGEFDGKHNQIRADMRTPGRVFLGSVRDPWKWYVSLWAFGCDGKGAVRERVTRRRSAYFDWRGWSRHPKSAAEALLRTVARDPDQWRRVYRDSRDKHAFREWLRMMHDPHSRRDFAEGYGTSPVSGVVGLMTYRYLKLFACPVATTAGMKAISTFDELESFERDHCFIDHFIRNENLEHDLLTALRKSGIEISGRDADRLASSPRTNRSSRQWGPEHYYDAASSRLVADRERLIIEKFGYAPPVLEPAGSAEPAEQPRGATG